MRKQAFCICENKDADQLRGNREADQRLCFRYTDRTIPLLPTSKISSLYPSSVAVQPGLCRIWSETPKTGFLTTKLIPVLIMPVLRDCLFVPLEVMHYGDPKASPRVYMSLVVRKPIFGVSDQVRHKPVVQSQKCLEA